MLYDYYCFDKLYNQTETDLIIDVAEKNVSERYSDTFTGNVKKVNTIVIETEKFHGLLDKFFQNVYRVNEEAYGFKIFKDYPRTVNVNFYSGNNNEYGYHKDINKPGSACDIKLTAIMNISRRSYTGGNLILFYGEERHMTQLDHSGNMLIFPSPLYHRVTPVEFGERISLSAWFNGPNWR